MSNPYELPKDLLHEVIVRTIEFDNISNEIIRTAFGLEIEWGGENESIPTNLNEINRFNKFFLENLGSSSRAELLLNVVEDICKTNKEEVAKCKDFKNKLINFYKIRNIFAHNIYPKDLQGFTRLESSEPHWNILAKQHEELFNELEEFLMNICYKKID